MPNGSAHSAYGYRFAQQEPAHLAEGLPATRIALPALVGHCLGRPLWSKLGESGVRLLMADRGHRSDSTERPLHNSEQPSWQEGPV